MKRRRAWFILVVMAISGAAAWRASGDASVPGAVKARDPSKARAVDVPGIDLCADVQIPVPDGGDAWKHLPGGVSQVFKLASMYAHQRTLRLADGPDEVHRDQVGRLEISKYN